MAQDRSYEREDGTDALVALILVSHSRAIAEGIAELVGQIAPGVPIAGVGGAVDGTLGTDVSRICASLRAVGPRRHAVVLVDIGSSLLSVRAALGLLGEEQRARVHVADAPLVEGAIAAGVAAAARAPASAVVHAAEETRRALKL